MENLPHSLIQLPMPWSDTKAQWLAEEAQSCFYELDQSISVVHLISVGGLDNQDLPMSGNLKETSHLQSLPYLRYLLACIKPVLGRVCLVQPSADKALTVSPLYQSRTYKLFYQTIAIAISHEIQLIIETKCPWHSSSDFYDSERLNTVNQTSLSASTQQPLNLAKPQLDILQTGQIKFYLSTLLLISQKYLTQSQHETLEQACDAFATRWETLYALFRQDYNGEWSYQSALNEFRLNIAPAIRTKLSEMPEKDHSDIEDALQIINTQLQVFPIPPQRINRKLLIKAKGRKKIQPTQVSNTEIFDRPIFIVSTPRAGSTLLFETLSQFSEIWSTGEENHASLENIPGLHPKDHHFDSNRLDASSLNATTSEAVKKVFISKLHDRNQHYYLEIDEDDRPSQIRFLEKTPKNALRIPFIKALFPDALFLYLKRDQKSNVSSLIDGWRSHQFIAYKNIPGFENRHWKFLLIPKWQSLHNRSIANIAHQQWLQSNHIIQQDLAALSEQCWMSVDYEALTTQPETVVRQFADFADLRWDQVIQERCQNELPVSRLTLSSPQKDKWKKHDVYFEALVSKSR